MDTHLLLEAAAMSLFGLGIIAWFNLLSGPNAVLRVGRSKSSYKKLKKSLSFSDRLLRRHYVELAKSEKRLQRYFVVMTYIFYLIAIILVLCPIIYRFIPNFHTVFCYFCIIKGVLIELPALIVVIGNTTRTNNGIEWRFELESRRKKRGGH